MTDPPHNTRQPWAVLALGLWTTVAMWAVAYLALMRPGQLMGEALFVTMLLCIVGGGVIAGRRAGGGWKTGARVGLVSAAFNLVIVGSLIGGSSEDGLATAALIWLAMTLGVSALLGATGAAIGARSRVLSGTDAAPTNWYGMFTKAVVAAAFLLLVSGGIVTGTETGLAVPDWPGSFGHNMILYPLTQMTSDESVQAGVHYEHAHRLYGMLIGLASMTLVGTIFVADRRTWLRNLCIAVFVLVVVQGLFGGFRVTEKNTALAIIHGVNAQIIFGGLVAIAAFTSSTWKKPTGVVSHAGVSTDRTMSLTLVIVLIVQLTLGATYRHMNSVEGINEAAVTGILHTHIVVAVVVLGMVVFLGIRSIKFYREQPAVRRTGLALKLAVAVQVLLGIVAMVMVLGREPGEAIPMSEVTITTLHQATGAALVGLATLHMLWTRRLLEPLATVGPVEREARASTDS